MTVSDTSVAVIGAACRLPGANSLSEFWDVLAGARCVITQVDEERFGWRQFQASERATPGRAVTFAAGQIERPFDFDPSYFGISPREAAVMDPQQRVLLEVTTEAVHSAGIPASLMAGTDVGVYVGASTLDYSYHGVGDPTIIEPQSMLGNTLSVIANRISYILDLRGPSYTIDTACSSSLIALHNALEDIRRGRVETAIVAGVSLLFNFIPFIGFSRAQMLSENGLCRAFDAGADGYVRSEGAVTLVLRAEAAARANGDPIRARLLASGVNADGRTPGLSLPSESAQAALLRAVYEPAELNPDDLAFVEAHGTGTPVGDPIEARAIGEVLGRRRRDPLLVGSSKTNFGHLEPASGLVGVLKAQEALRRNTLPASLHFEAPNPNIPFAKLNLSVADRSTPLDERSGDALRLAGVNSFGFGGANAHVVVADGDADPGGIEETALPAVPLLVSAATAEALTALAGRFADCVERYGARTVANAAAYRRDRLSKRAVVAAAPAADMHAALCALARGDDHPLITGGQADNRSSAPVFVYSGNGSQWAGMGRSAYQGDADFRDSFERTDRLFMSVAGWSLVTTLFSSDLDAEIERTEVAQPLLFALQVALTEALMRQGLRPAAVLGHSVGEVAAGWTAGALSLADAVRVIHARSTQQEVTRHLGGMAALLLPADEAQSAIAGHAGLELAAVNSPRSVTISGPTESLAAFAKHARKKRWAMKRLPLDYPFHCALVDPIRDPLVQALAAITPRESSLPMISTVTGEVVPGTVLDAEYWWRNVREPVRFADAMTEALNGYGFFVEIGPRPVLTGYVNDCARSAGAHATVLSSLAQDDECADAVSAVLRTALAHGAKIDDIAVFGRKAAPPDVLPAYPWQRQEYRTERSVEEVRVMLALDHPFLGKRLREDDTEWRGTLSVDRLPFLADHKVEDTVVFPAAGFVEMVLAAGAALHPGVPIELSGLDIFAPLVLDGVGEREVRTAEIAPGTMLISSRPRLSADGWTPHVKATVGPAPAPPVAPALREGDTLGAGEHRLTAPDLYRLTTAFGLPYGPAFRRAEDVTIAGQRGHIRLAASDPAVARHQFTLDPTLFDACFHGLFAFVAGNGTGANGAVALLPIRVDRLRVAAGAGAPVEAMMEVVRPSEDVAEANFTLRDEAGAVVAQADGVRFQAVPLAADGPPVLKAEPQMRRLSRALDPARAPIPVPSHLTVDEADPSETALLVEAGVQAAAALALQGLLSEPAPLQSLCTAGALKPETQPLAVRLLLALEAAGAAEQVGRAWRILPTSLNVDDVVGILVGDYPERLAEAAMIAALPDRMLTAFSDGFAAVPPVSDALLQLLQTDAPTFAPLFDALAETLEHAIADAAPASFGVCVVGAENTAFLRRVCAMTVPDRMAVTITDIDSVVAERASLVVPRTPCVEIVPLSDATNNGHRYDLVLLTPRLSAADVSDVVDLLKPGGTLIGLAPAPSLFGDAVGGFDPLWWEGSLDQDTPLGRLATAEEWTDVLGEAGLSDVMAAPLASGETDAILFRGVRGSDAGALLPDPAELDLIAIGGHAAKIADALCALRFEPDQDASSRAMLIAVSADNPEDLPRVLADLRERLIAVGDEPRRVTIVSVGAHGEAGRDVSPTGAAIAAFVRTAMNEMAHLDMRLVDIQKSFDVSAAAVRLHNELQQPNAEREVVLSSDHRSAVRYVPSPAAHGDGDERVLAIPRRGSIDHLVWQPRARVPLQPGEVRLRVETSGLNFRDVMWALGLLPHEALQDGYAGPTLGMECAGVVDEVASDVTDVLPGEPVIAFAPASFASHVVVRANAMVTRPAGLSADAAATIPVAFLTAFYALDELARVREGETVLIHGGAGGVGLAALQIARWRGARVFATAGSPEKRALLMRLGAERVFDSRGLTFADEARAATNGEGVDVVLNSLAGEAMERSIGALKPFGRFLELGKRDFYADTKLGLRPFRQNLSYFGIDADQLMKHRPALAKTLLSRVMALFEEGELAPLPYRAFAPDGVHDAFRLMQSAGHIGKIVVRAPQSDAAKPPVATPISQDGTYLLVGGTSGFGFATAEWLIGEGARHLILASRSGVKDDTVSAAIDQHRGAGVSIRVETLDVTDQEAVHALVASVDNAHPLTGVFHMAMVLDDALIASLDEERIARVLSPKALGVEALEAACANTALSLFVVYSSITVQVGNPGQANYVAANAYLEGVARRRRAAGKPALAVAWGAISDVGVLSRDMATSNLLKQKLGRHAITAAEGLAELGQLLQAGAMYSGASLRMVGQIDWAAARKDLVLARSPSFADIAEVSAPGGDDGAAIDLSERLAGMSEAEAVQEVSGMLAGEISRILKMPVSEVDPAKPLTALGMDSLMGVELRMAAEQRLGIEVPLMSLASGATILDLSKKVVERTLGQADDTLEGAFGEVHARHVAGAGDVDENVKDVATAMEARVDSVRSLLP